VAAETIEHRGRGMEGSELLGVDGGGELLPITSAWRR